MKKKMIIQLIVFFGAGAVILALGQKESCGAAAGAKQFEAVRVTDVSGREVVITKTVSRIGYVHMGTAEGLKLLDAWDMVVLKDGYTNDDVLFPGIENIPSLNAPMGNPYEPDYEVLFSSDIDLLIVEVIPMPGLEDMLEKTKNRIPVFTCKLYEHDGLIEGLRGLGKILGKEKEAEEFIGWYEDITGVLSEKVGTVTVDRMPHVFFKTGYGSAEEMMTFTDELSYAPYRNRMTGCVNVAAAIPSRGGFAPSIDSEWLVSREIDVIIVQDAMPGKTGTGKTDFSPVDLHRQRVMRLPVFSHTDAVKNERVYIWGEPLFGTPRFIVGLVYLAKWFHPGVFTDLDPKAVHQEYLDKFMGVDVNLNTQGVFVYPEE